VVELQRTVQRGNALLRRKEEQLLQLESSMAEEVTENTERTTKNNTSVVLSRSRGHFMDLNFESCVQPFVEDASRPAGDRKVTFDVTESDLSSTLDPPGRTTTPRR